MMCEHIVSVAIGLVNQTLNLFIDGLGHLVTVVSMLTDLLAQKDEFFFLNKGDRT
jgi:hypothetical protein